MCEIIQTENVSHYDSLEMGSGAIKLTQANLVNENLLTIGFSDGTVGLFTAATLLASAIKRVSSAESFSEYPFATAHSRMPDSQLALADNLRSLPETP